MQKQNRIISMLLALVLMVGCIPVQAFAEGAAASSAAVDTGDVAIEGTNSFGTLLTAQITESQEAREETASDYQAGYSVTDLVIEENVATVTFNTLNEANLVVALYAEDGMQLLASGRTTVSPDETQAAVTIEGDMPEYFLASVYLLDTYDLSPLCASYDTPMYTQEMQALLASTADDYDADRVLTLDDDKTTNFAVYADSTILIESVDGSNQVTGIDDENRIYVIENADESVTSLQVGDIFVCPSAKDERLIVKVAAITVDGTTVTITGGDLEMEEVFQVVKIESSSSEVEVDDSTADEGIEYVGPAEYGPATFAAVDGGSATASHEYEVDIKAEASGDDVSASMEVKGSLLIEVEASVFYYVTALYQFIEFRVTPRVTLEVGVTGNVAVSHSCGNLGITPVAGVFVGLSPELKLEFEGEAELTIVVQTTVGVGFDTLNKFQNLSTAPEVDIDLSVEGTIFFGIDFHPNVTLLDGVAAIELVALVGLEIEAVMTGTVYDGYDENALSRHECAKCLSMDLQFKAELNGELSFFVPDGPSFPVEIGEFTIPLGSMYYSFDNSRFDFGECPNYTYRVTVEVLDLDKQPLAGQEVTVSTLEDPLVTNRYGVAVFYTPAGTIQLRAEKDGYFDAWKLAVDGARKVRLDLTNQVGTVKEDWIFGTVDSGELLDQTAIIAYGQAGDKIDWTLYGSGKLVLEGSGNMWHWQSRSAPWNSYKDQILSVEIMEGITNIGAYAFYYHTNLTSVSIPGSVTHIWKSAFDSCYSLTSIVIPEGVTYLGYTVFWGCPLTSITLPVTLLQIDYYAFRLCSSLSDIYYGGTEEQWNQIDFVNNYYYDEFAKATVHYNSTSTASVHVDAPVTLSIFGGEYETELTDSYSLKTASFTGLVPGADYVLLSLISMEAEDLIAADNLLFIDQAAADEDGKLVFEYVQRTPTSAAYVMACGPSDQDLADAVITFPHITADGEIRAVAPTVVYDGETLVEGRDYTVAGTVSFTQAGTYTCYIRGIHDYTGLVECSYTVGRAGFRFDNVRMRLENALDMDFAFHALYEADWTGAYVEIVQSRADGTTQKQTVAYEDWNIRDSDNAYYVTFTGIAAKEMADVLQVTVYDASGEAISDIYTDSVRGYAMRMLEGETAKGKTLFVDMLNYGAGAQSYFGYNTEDLANNALTETQREYATDTVYYANCRVAGDNYLGTRLLLESRIQIQFAFEDLSENMKAVVSYTNHYEDEQRYELDDSAFSKQGNIWVVAVETTVVADGRCPITVEIFDGETVVASVQDSMESYIARMYNDNPLYELIMKFSDSAYGYLHLEQV